MGRSTQQAAVTEELLHESGWMRVLSLHLASDSDAAQDLLQDTWVNLLRNPRAGRRPVRAWVDMGAIVAVNALAVRARTSSTLQSW